MTKDQRRKTKDAYDIVIVGGGMAGASLACALSDSGMSIAIIEAVPWQSSSQPSYDVRTISLSHGSRLIYESLDVWSKIDAKAICPIHQIHISDRGRAGITHLDRTDANVEALGYVIENRALGAALMSTLAPKENIEIISPATVVDVQVKGQVTTMTCELSEAGTNGSEKKTNLSLTLTAKLMVLADGGRSPLRETMGFQPENDDYGQTAIVCNITPGQHHQHCAYERFTESGPLAVLPMNDDRCWCVWAVESKDVDALLALDEKKFLQRLQHQFGDRLGRLSRVGQRYSYPLSRSLIKNHVVPRVVLVGNAAHTVHPVAAQGFNLGLRDVAWLAEVLTEAVRDGIDPGSIEVLKRYEEIRHIDTKRVTSFTHGMIKVFTSRVAPVVASRNAALHLTDMIPGIKRALLKRTMGLTGKQSRLARGLTLESMLEQGQEERSTDD